MLELPSTGTVLLGLATGFLGGVLSGMFGIGGGVVTTPLIRLLMSVSAIQSVATTLPAIVPSAVTGSVQYVRAKIADWRVGLATGLAGAVTSSLGALAVTEVGGPIALLATAAMIFYAAGDTLHSLAQDRRQSGAGEEQRGATARPSLTVRATYGRAAIIGVLAGFYSGFLGVGGGFLIVPMLRRWIGMTHKQAVGTSLFAVAILAVPGTVTHGLLGNIDWTVALTLALGVVPGAALGAKIMVQTSERIAKISFAVLMVVLGSWLIVNELSALGQGIA